MVHIRSRVLNVNVRSFCAFAKKWQYFFLFNMFVKVTSQELIILILNNWAHNAIFFQKTQYIFIKSLEYKKFHILNLY